MNAKTAKMLSRAGAALAVISISRYDLSKLTPEQKVFVTQDTARSSYERLKRRWKSTPRPHRHALRKALLDLTMKVKHGYHKGVVSGAA